MPSVSSVRIPGLATGMDTDTMIKEMLKGEQNKVDKAKQKEQTTKWQQEIYREIIKDTKGFEDKYFSLSSKNSLLSSSAWSTLGVTSSNSSVITATGNAGANKVDYKIEVNKLALAPKATSTKAANNKPIERVSKLSDLGLNSQNKFKINLGDSTNSKVITIGPDDTIESMIGKINDSTDGDVKASFSDMTGELIIESSKTGKNSEMKILNEDGSASSGLNFLGLKTTNYELQPDGSFQLDANKKPISKIEDFNGKAVGSNSIVQVSSKDGTLIKSLTQGSNSFTIDEVTYNVHAIGSADITSKQEVQPVVDNMKAFVEDYNKIMDKVYDLLTEKKKAEYPPLTEAQKKDMSEEEIERWEKKAKEGILRNDSEMRKFMDDMQKSIFGDKMSVLNEMGLTSHDDYNKKGQIALDEKKFTKALENNSDKVYQTFAKDDSSVLERMKSTIKDYTGGSSSIFARKAGLEKTASAVNNFYSEQLKRQEETIKKIQRKMDERESQLYKQFANLESSMNKLNSQMSYFSQM
jgi:flagellar hook-associated protein 2